MGSYLFLSLSFLLLSLPLCLSWGRCLISLPSLVLLVPISSLSSLPLPLLLSPPFLLSSLPPCPSLDICSSPLSCQLPVLPLLPCALPFSVSQLDKENHLSRLFFSS